ncbi:MAG: S-adenosylmethionine decarboxylase family protein [Geminicoccales bacterium]
MSEAFGQHLIVDAAGCNHRISDRDSIANFAKDLVQAIDMKAYGAPWIEHFGHDLPKASGFTLVQLIETSNISAHFCDDSGEAYFDIFSCKAFDEAVAIEVIQAYFEPIKCQTQNLNRQAPKLDEDRGDEDKGDAAASMSYAS